MLLCVAVCCRCLLVLWFVVECCCLMLFGCSLCVDVVYCLCVFVVVVCCLFGGVRYLSFGVVCCCLWFRCVLVVCCGGAFLSLRCRCLVF